MSEKERESVSEKERERERERVTEQFKFQIKPQFGQNSICERQSVTKGSNGKILKLPVFSSKCRSVVATV